MVQIHYFSVKEGRVKMPIYGSLSQHLPLIFFNNIIPQHQHIKACSKKASNRIIR